MAQANPPGHGGPGDDLREVDEQIDTILRGWGGARERRQPWQAVARFLDMLVISTRREQKSARYVAGRLAEFWRKLDDRTIVLEPTEMWVTGKQALVAEGDVGRWILPSYLAGLRALTAREELLPEDLERLAIELAVLEPDVERIGAFRDWLWSAGAQGLDVDLAPSALDALDVVPVAELEGASAEPEVPSSIDTWNEIAQHAGRELDGPTQERAYRAPIARYTRAAREGTLTLASEELALLRDAAGDPVAWPLFELDAVRSRPALKGAVPPEHLAARVVAQIENSPRVDRRLFDTLTELGRSRDAYASALMEALSTEQVGSAIGDAVDFQEVDPGALAGFLEEAHASLCKGLLARVSKRSAGDDTAMTALLALLERWGLNDFMRRVDVSKLDPAPAAALAKKLVASETPLPFLRAFLSRMPTGSSAMVWAREPTLVASMRDLVRSLLHEAPSHATLLVQQLLEGGHGDLVADALLSSQGNGWSDKMMQLAVSGLVGGGKHDEALVELARARNARLQLRLLVLDRLRERPALLARAVKWRPSELLEPEEIRNRMRELRQSLR